MSLIELDQVGLEFRVRRQKRIDLKEYLLRGMFRRSADSSVHVRALDDVSLVIAEGERLGIIGHNGAGKSSLLRLLAGIYPPTSGRRIVRGQISSLFDIALGFEPDATGWENILYRGYLQGETPRSMRSKVQPIAQFSELGSFLDLPVRYLSQGMRVRLAFSIATAVEPEILIVDEVLSAGDLGFQAKARARMLTLIESARAVVLVSHDLESIRNICDRVLWLDHGRSRAIGPPDEVVDAYSAAYGDRKRAKAA
jgi:ABC-type polysaccharide/polyol phosphate transport system ATPase subunit